MPYLLLQELPRYESLLEAAEQYPTLNVSAAEVFLNLLRTGDLVVGAEGDYLGDYGITQGRFTVLMILSRVCSGSVSPALLAEKSGVTRATMSGLLDTMERDGLVSRAESSTDRRMVAVKLTVAGQELVDAILPGYFSRVNEWIRPLALEERKVFVVLLQKIQRGIACPTPNDIAESVHSVF